MAYEATATAGTDDATTALAVDYGFRLDETPRARKRRLERERKAVREALGPDALATWQAKRAKRAALLANRDNDDDAETDTPRPSAQQRDRQHVTACMAAGGFPTALSTPAGTVWSYPTHQPREGTDCDNPGAAAA